MKVESTSSGPEKIMLFGDWGAGKSYDWITIAEYLSRWENVCTFRVIDTEDAIPRNLEEFEGFVYLGRKKYYKEKFVRIYKRNGVTILVYSCLRFDETMAATEIICKEAKEDDWNIVDRSSVVWNQAPIYYVQTRLKTTMEAIELAYMTRESRGKSTGGSAMLQHYANGINPMYWAWEDRILYDTGAHVVFCVSETGLNDKEGATIVDSQAMQKLCETIGVKPSGNNKTASKFHTVIRKVQTYQDQWRHYTMRDRGKRARLNDRTKIQNFAEGYLIDPAYAKWKLVP